MEMAASDVSHIEPHGTELTHLDALNHMGRGGTWYGGFDADDPDVSSIIDLANHVLFTRGLLVDVPEVRGTDWVDPALPVTGEDIEASLARNHAHFEPGDALLLYMGRDRYEMAGHKCDVATRLTAKIPGAGSGVARWIAEHDVSVLAWDFLDAHPHSEDEPSFQVHSLLWAIGLPLVDNCELGRAAAEVRKSGRPAGAFIVATPPVPRATGALVQPLFVQ
jgi:kynurenine formamidase